MNQRWRRLVAKRAQRQRMLLRLPLSSPLPFLALAREAAVAADMLRIMSDALGDMLDHLRRARR